MAALEATVVGTALPTIVGDLGGLELYGWVGAVYMLASTVTIPLYGKMADLYGRKPILFLSYAVFLAGSIASGMAGSMTALLVFRAVQGVGAGGITPVALTIVGDLFTVEERGKIAGLFGAVWGLAGMVGPVVGGLIVRALSWRWVFLINVPVGVLAGLTLQLFFHESVERRQRKIDLVGAALLAVSILALLLGATGERPIVAGSAAIAALVGFIAVEKRAEEPILPLPLMARPLIAASNVASAFLGGLMFIPLTFVPLYMQAVLESTPTEAGMSVAPMLVGWPLASATSSRFLARIGPQPLVRVGCILVALGTGGVAWSLAPGATFTGVRVSMFLVGVGQGIATTALVIAVQQAVPWEERGVATAATMFFRTIGGTLAVGVLGAVFARGLGSEVPTALLNRLVGPEHGKNLDPSLARPLAASIAHALRLVFLATAGVGAAGALVGIAFPKATPMDAVKDGGPTTLVE
jgi:EmrB/QacA subfamily drug resistance transporter